MQYYSHVAAVSVVLWGFLFIVWLGGHFIPKNGKLSNIHETHCSKQILGYILFFIFWLFTPAIHDTLLKLSQISMTEPAAHSWRTWIYEPGAFLIGYFTSGLCLTSLVTFWHVRYIWWEMVADQLCRVLQNLCFLEFAHNVHWCLLWNMRYPN